MAYKIKKTQVRFTNLPFEPSAGDVIYMSNRFDAAVDRYIRENIKELKEDYSCPYVMLDFIYLPVLSDDIIEYYAPQQANSRFVNHVDSSALLDYLADPAEREELTNCLLCYRKKIEGDDNIYVFNCQIFQADGSEDMKDLFDELYSHYFQANTFFNLHPEVFGDYYHTEEKENEQTIRRLMGEINSKIAELRKHGVSEWTLRQILPRPVRMSRLVVTEDMHIILPNYNNMKIVMEPLVMAVYMLFLRHPEGIIFKALPDYRQELTDIYIDVIRRRGEQCHALSSRQLSAIDKVTDPLNNSINEKCARIKHAFLMKFAERMAESYYITGQRGELKRITLSRKSVTYPQGYIADDTSEPIKHIID